MASKLSQRLQQRLKVSNVDENVPLTVLLKASLPEQAVQTSMKQVQELGAAGIQFIPVSGTLHFTAGLNVARKIQDLETVDYVDIESSAPIEDLLDG